MSRVQQACTQLSTIHGLMLPVEGTQGTNSFMNSNWSSEQLELYLILFVCLFVFHLVFFLQGKKV